MESSEIKNGIILDSTLYEAKLGTFKSRKTSIESWADGKVQVEIRCRLW